MHSSRRHRCGFGVSPKWLARLVVFGWAVPVTAWSQVAAGAVPSSGIVIVPRVSVTETFTNNALLQSNGKRSDLISQISPGIRISSSGGRIRGSLDYALNEVVYANGTSGRQSQNALTTAGSIEAIDNWAFVDFSGSISQQAVSAFGTFSNNPGTLGGNSTETSVFRLSPYVRGRLAGFADYEARYSLTTNRSRSAVVSDVNSDDMSVRLSSVASRPGSGWSLQAELQSTDYAAGRSTQSQRLNGQLNYPFNNQWGTYVRASHESNDFATATSQQGNFSALGVNWTPNEETRFGIDRDTSGATGLAINWAPSKRTSVSVTRERRLFGDTQTIALSYRTANTAWAFSDSKGTTTGQPSATGTVSLYNLLSTQFAQGESDPVKREQYSVFLQSNGITPGAIAIGGFLSSAISLQHQQQLSFVVFGARNTLSVVATRSSNTKIDTISTFVDDFATSSVVKQSGLTVTLSHRLTPRASLSLASSQQRSSGSLGQPGTSFRSVNLNLSTQLTRDTSASLGARRVLFDSTTSPYSETAVTGNLNVRF